MNSRVSGPCSLALLLAGCGAVDFHAYPEPGDWSTTGPGGPTCSFTEAELGQPCAYLTGGEQDVEHHNLVGMHDGWLLMPWAPEDGGGGLTFFDLSDPCDPQKIGEAYAPEMRESHTLAISRVGDRELLAVDYHQDGDVGGVGFWDISDPSAPTWLSGLALPDYHYPDAYFRVALSTFWVGDILYVASGLSGVFVIDVSDPEQPEILSQHSTIAHLVGAVHVVGTMAMVSSAGISRTILYDLSDPLSFEPIGGGDFEVSDSQGDQTNYYFADVGGAWGLFARNSDGGGPIVYDLSDPSDPTFLGDARNYDGDGGYLMRQGHRLYQGDSNFGSVYDASDPSDLVEVLRLDLQGDLDTISPIGNVAVVSVDEGANPGQATGVFPAYLEPDTQAPVVELVSPAEGALWVADTARIGVSLDEAIEPRSVHPGSFRVWTALGDSVEGVFNTQETIVNFTPSEALLPATTYVVELPAGGVADVSGNPVAEGLRWRFSTSGELLPEDD